MNSNRSRHATTVKYNKSNIAKIFAFKQIPKCHCMAETIVQRKIFHTAGSSARRPEGLEPEGTWFFPEPKIFGSADGWPAEGRPAGGGAR